MIQWRCLPESTTRAARSAVPGEVPSPLHQPAQHSTDHCQRLLVTPGLASLEIRRYLTAIMFRDHLYVDLARGTVRVLRAWAVRPYTPKLVLEHSFETYSLATINRVRYPHHWYSFPASLLPNLLSTIPCQPRRFTVFRVCPLHTITARLEIQNHGLRHPEADFSQTHHPSALRGAFLRADWRRDHPQPRRRAPASLLLLLHLFYFKTRVLVPRRVLGGGCWSTSSSTRLSSTSRPHNVLPRSPSSSPGASESASFSLPGKHPLLPCLLNYITDIHG